MPNVPYKQRYIGRTRTPDKEITNDLDRLYLLDKPNPQKGGMVVKKENLNPPLHPRNPHRVHSQFTPHAIHTPIITQVLLEKGRTHPRTTEIGAHLLNIHFLLHNWTCSQHETGNNKTEDANINQKYPQTLAHCGFWNKNGQRIGLQLGIGQAIVDRPWLIDLKCPPQHQVVANQHEQKPQQQSNKEIHKNSSNKKTWQMPGTKKALKK